MELFNFPEYNQPIGKIFKTMLKQVFQQPNVHWVVEILVFSTFTICIRLIINGVLNGV